MPDFTHRQRVFHSFPFGPSHLCYYGLCWLLAPHRCVALSGTKRALPR